jgi:hypothetical protein
MKDQNFWTNRIKESAVLNRIDRTSEVLFGLIMVLSFTGAISASTDAREDVRELLWAALGCNVAWGLVDAIMYLMNVAVERGHAIQVVKKIHASTSSDDAGQILKDEMQPVIAGLMTPAELSELGSRLKSISPPSRKHVITVHDLWAGIQIFLLVFLCTFPVVLSGCCQKQTGKSSDLYHLLSLLLLQSLRILCRAGNPFCHRGF